MRNIDGILLFGGEIFDFLEIDLFDGGAESLLASVMGMIAGAVGEHVLGKGEGDDALELGAKSAGGGGGGTVFADILHGDF